MIITYTQQLRSLQDRQGIDLADLCRRAGISRTTYWLWQSGKSNPTHKTIEAINRVLVDGNAIQSADQAIHD